MAQRVDAAALTRLGAMGVVRPAPTAVQVVLGPIADQVAGEIRQFLRPGPAPAALAVTAAAVVEATGISPTALLAALGGAANITLVEAAAGRVLVSVARMEKVDRGALTALASRGVAITSSGAIQVLAGTGAVHCSEALRTLL